MKSKSLILTLITIFCLIFNQSVFAARLAKGKSYGMKRSYSANNYNIPNNNTQPNRQYNNQYNNQYNTQPTQPSPRQGMGAGTGALLGAAAGGVAGYMLGKSAANHNNASDVQVANAYSEQVTQSHIPWGIIAILAVLLFIGLIIFRRNRPVSNINTPDPFKTNNNSSNSFEIPSINKSNSIKPLESQGGQSSTSNIDKMPDGIETIYFLRQAKGTFLHIQSMNNKENVTEIAKYMTDDLYNEIKNDIINNQNVADFTQLNCELIESTVVDKKLIASVKFSGLVSEEPNQSPEPFSEIWHFVKEDINSNKWLISGIQQIQ